jgi:hypothetical protein
MLLLAEVCERQRRQWDSDPQLAVHCKHVCGFHVESSGLKLVCGPLHVLLVAALSQHAMLV